MQRSGPACLGGVVDEIVQVKHVDVERVEFAQR